MARKTSKFMIGLFVTVGVLIGMAAVIWLGASKYFEKGKKFVTYFDESVQGLQVDSTVKYRGVEVGSVEAIRVAPDNKLIEVVMKIDVRGQLDRDYVAQLKAAGITGIVFIELDRKYPGKPDVSPKVDFAAEYPIIPSQPSDIKQILAGVDEIFQSIRKVDTQGISDQIKSTTKEIGDFVGGQKMDKILTELASTATNIRSITAKLDEGLSEGRFKEILVELRNAIQKIETLTTSVQDEIRSMNLAKTGASLESASARVDKILAPGGEVQAILAEAKGVFTKAQASIEALNLNETVGKMNQVLDGVDKRTLALANSLKVTSENLRRASESLETLIQRISANPSDLIFGEPTPPRRVK
jgi:phospholipid/cholesterol/gamma-HCH transport system substrate-binding protein